MRRWREYFWGAKVSECRENPEVRLSRDECVLNYELESADRLEKLKRFYRFTDCREVN